MPSRRQFLGAMSVPAVAALGGVYLHPARLARALAAVDEPAGVRSPQTVAADEDFWSRMVQDFTVLRSLV